MRGSVVSSSCEQERAELEAVLRSERFSRSPQLAKLLVYLCEKVFEGHADQIKEYSIATEVLGRPVEFDSSQDAIARVEAHRLRKKLADYYADEGTEHQLKIVLAPGKYVPVFQRPRKAASARAISVEERAAANRDSTEHVVAIPPEPAELPLPDGRGSVDAPGPSAQTRGSDTGESVDSNRFAHGSDPGRRWRVYLVGAACVLITVLVIWRMASRDVIAHSGPAAGALARLLPVLERSGSPVRLVAGCTSAGYTDQSGNHWDCDRYVTGGHSATYPDRHIARTRDQFLFQNVRSGDFYYSIPLKPGMYELHLFFSELAFGPGMPRGGGENSRTFLVKLNGHVLLDAFDVLADASGPAIADERVFRDVHPDADGRLHLQFFSESGEPILSAIEIVPGIPGRQLPVRLVTQEKSVTDRSGNVWAPDDFYAGGQLNVRKETVTGTEDANLYAAERFGNFSYAIPVDTRDVYGVTVHFAEGFWGSQLDRTGSGAGSRIFDVDCNGQRLLNNLDIYKEVGGMHALSKTFHGLRPNAQGKLILSFGPVVNYASVSALEVEDEGK
jgi:hypothetical protein